MHPLLPLHSLENQRAALLPPGRKILFLSHFRDAPAPRIKASSPGPGHAGAPSPGAERPAGAWGGGRETRASPGDRPGTPGGGRGSLSPRVAVGRGTRTRRTRPRAPARGGGGAGGGQGAESLRAPVRPPAAVEGGARLTRAPLGLLLPLTTAAALPRPRAARPRPYPGVPARLSGRGTSFAPLLGGRRKSPHATASAHACSVAGLYKRDAA